MLNGPTFRSRANVYQGNENKERVGGKIITPTLFYVYGGGYRNYGMVSYFNKSIFRKAR